MPGGTEVELFWFLSCVLAGEGKEGACFPGSSHSNLKGETK